MSKYGNERVFDEEWGWFDSQHEYMCFKAELSRQERGEIRNLKRQVKFVLQDAFQCGREKIGAITYVADMTFEESPDWRQIASDPKGVETSVFKLKYKLFRKRYPHIELRIVK